MNSGTQNGGNLPPAKAMHDENVPESSGMSGPGSLNGNELERLKLVLSSAEIGTWEWDASSGAMRWDERMHALFGCDADTFAGRYENFLSLIAADDRGRVGLEMLAAASNGDGYDGEFRVIWPADASTHIVRSRAKVYYDAGEAAVRVVGVCWDVTKRRQTEQQLAAQGNLLTMLMDSLPDYIYFKDRESRFIAVNSSQASRCGLKPEEMIGKSDFDAFSREHAQQAFDDEQKVIATGEPIVGLVEKETWPNGNINWVSTTKLPLRDEKGEIIGTFGLSRDVTENKRVQEDLARIAGELRAKNAALEEDLEMARELQSALLPQRYPHFPHGATMAESAVHFYHFYRPSTTVSGDFFDTFQIGDDLAGLFMCDVMGHGVRAALVAAIMRTLVGELGDARENPAEFLTQLNSALRSALKHLDMPLFASAFYVVADLARGELRYANAGHPHPLCIRQHHTRRFKKPIPLNGRKPGPALGLFDKVQYEGCRSTLSPNDMILLFTDGLFEVEGRNGDLYDYPRFISAVTQRSLLPPTDLCHGIVDEIQRFSPEGKFTDDVCLVVMEIERLAASAA